MMQGTTGLFSGDICKYRHAEVRFTRIDSPTAFIGSFCATRWHNVIMTSDLIRKSVSIGPIKNHDFMYVRPTNYNAYRFVFQYTSSWAPCILVRSKSLLKDQIVCHLDAFYSFVKLLLVSFKKEINADRNRCGSSWECGFLRLNYGGRLPLLGDQNTTSVAN